MTTVVHAACSGLLSPSFTMVEPPLNMSGAVPDGCLRRVALLEPGHAPLIGERLRRVPEPKTQHVMAMFREPKQRLMSGYFHGRHDCFEPLGKAVAPGCFSQDANMSSEACRDILTVSLEEVERYAECVGSCQTRMVAGDSCNGAPASPAQLRIALDTIEGMGFVGLIGEYELSVCLFHTMFGGQCQTAEFGDLRRGAKSKRGEGYGAPASPKLDRLLEFDSITYAAARDRFWRDVREHHVTRASCARLCDRPTHVFGRDASMVLAKM